MHLIMMFLRIESGAPPEQQVKTTFGEGSKL